MAKSKKELADWLASIGVDLSTEKLAEKPIEQEISTQQMGKWEAQSLLTSLTYPYPELVKVACWECKQDFLTNYKANTYCSMQCYKDALKKKGIAWRPERTFFEQWGNLEPPLMISPEAVKAMRRLLNLLDQENPAQMYNQEPDYVEEELIEASPVSPSPPIPYNDPETPKEHDSELDSFASELDALFE